MHCRQSVNDGCMYNTSMACSVCIGTMFSTAISYILSPCIMGLVLTLYSDNSTLINESGFRPTAICG